MERHSSITGRAEKHLNRLEFTSGNLFFYCIRLKAKLLFQLPDDRSTDEKMHCYFPKRRSAPLFATEHKDETHERGPTETQFQQAQFYFPMLNCQTNHNAFHQNSCSVYWKLVTRFNRATERKIEGPMEISNCAHYHFLPSLFSDLSALFWVIPLSLFFQQKIYKHISPADLSNCLYMCWEKSYTFICLEITKQ
jgi:hypothetical protein